MIRNADTVFQLILLAATLSVALLAPTKCRLRLSSRSARLNENENLTVLCDASCFGIDSPGMFGWYDKTNEEIPDSGRIFSMTYNRGRYSRLFIRNFTKDDAGVFVCSKMNGNERVNIPFHLNGDMVGGLEYDSGPERGDIYSNEFEIPDIRSVRSVRSRFRREASEQQSFISVSPSDDTTNESPSGDEQYTSTNYDVSPSTMQKMTQPDDSPTNKPESNVEQRSKAEPETTAEPETIAEPKPTTTEQTPKEGPPDNDNKKGTMVTTPKRNTPNEETKETPEKTIMTTTIKHPISKLSPNTEFGRRGLIAFVLTLAVAILLFYALLLTICIPRCLAKRKAMDLGKLQKAEKAEKNAPEAIKLSKVEDNGVPSPGPSDSGFTTIDLDEQTDKKEETVVLETEKKTSDAGATAEGNGQSSPEPPKEEIKENTAKSTDESLLNSILQVSGEKQDTKPIQSDIAFIDQTPSGSQSPTNTTPAVVDEPQNTNKTTEVRLDILESDDGHKQIKLSTSMPPPPEELLPPESPASGDDAFPSPDVNM